MCQTGRSAANDNPTNEISTHTPPHPMDRHLRLSRLSFFVLALLLGAAQTALAQLNITIQVTPPTCSGFTNGQATAVVSGGNGNYAYQWSNGQATQTAFGLSAGSYSVTVTDTDGNMGTRSATVTAPGALVATFAQAGAGGCNLTDAGTVSVTGGTGPYTYSWDNGQTTAAATGLGFGPACVTVTDAAGCQQTACFNVASPLSVTVDDASVLCFGGCDAVLIAEVEGGARPYTYLWSNGFTGAINDMLLPGTYSVVVTDANGCTATATARVLEPAPITVTFGTTQPNCGASNGSITAQASGGTGPYTYNYGTGTSGATLSNLAAGTYTVNVTDVNGCPGTGTVTLVAGTLQVSLTSTSPACGAGATGTATAVVTGGTAPYSYLYSNGSTASTAANLAPGVYTVTVTDANGCSGTASTTITAGSSLSATATATAELCAGSADGSASVLVVGGRAPFAYAWSNGGSDATIANLAPGSYSVTVTDANGCAAVANVTVGTVPALFCTVTTLQAISANGANDGIMTAQFNGGVMPYTVTWADGVSGQTRSNLGPGTYTATVTDGNSCTTTCSATLSEPVIAALGKIGDFVWRDLDRDGQQDPGEPGVASIRVELTRPDSTILRTNTDANGRYCFDDLQPGSYKVTFEILIGNDRFTIPNVGDDATDSDAVPMAINFRQVGMAASVTLAPGDSILTIDAGVVDACIPVTNPGTIQATDSMVCGIGADPGPITSVTPAVSTGAIRYLWMYNTVNDPNFNNWTVAPGTNNQESYDPGPLYANTFFARCAFGVDCNIPVETNVVQITVGTLSRAIISGPELTCVGETYTFSAADAGGGAQYAWDFGPRATPQTSTSRTVNVMWDLFGNRGVTLTVTRQGCVTTDVQRVAISNCVAPPPFVITTTRQSTGSVDVAWSMDDEHVPGVYQVQRSLDGGVKFETIGTVAITPSDLRQWYAFADATPKTGYNVYRVYRVLQPGDTYFSDEASVAFFSKEVDFVAYPNPAVDRVVLERYDNLELERTVEVVDLMGRVTARVPFPANQTRLEVDLAGTPAGQLHVRMLSEDGVINSVAITRQ